MNSTSGAADTETESGQREPTTRLQVQRIAVFFIVLIILIAATYLYCYIYKRIKAIDSGTGSHSNNHPFNTDQRRRRGSIISLTTATSSSDYDSDSGFISYGLDESTIHSLPMVLYFKIKTYEGVDCGDGSGCSICLQDYMDTDGIRLLPECGHYFHLKCVDTWLRIHPSCPICRNSQVRLSVVNPPPSGEEVAVISIQ